MNILLVEDSATLRLTMASVITEAGHQAVLAESGEAALAEIDRENIDFIFMDVEMPGLDGFETTRRIREKLGDNWLPIIFLTGKSDDESYLQGIQAGGDDYLIKPVSPVILTAKIAAMKRIVDMRNELQLLNQELELLSQIDGMTQLYNHRTFVQLAQEQWAQANRNSHPVALIMLDIDHFKLYNDHYGHPQGDECLKQVSKALKGTTKRPGDILARYGGEEFIVFLPNTDAKGAEKIANDIHDAVLGLEVEHIKSPTHDRVTVSIGVSVCHSTAGRTLNDMIKHADVALYNAKNKGRNGICVDQYLPSKTILIADDDPFILKVISSQLGNHCTVLTAANGRECTELAKDKLPDLILMDILMPEVDGLEACRQLKDDKKTAHIPIILISTLDGQSSIKQVKQSGANAYLEKPIEELRLLSKVNNFLT